MKLCALQRGGDTRGALVSPEDPGSYELIVDAGEVINCIPTAMPFIDSLFMPRELDDSPLVLPDGEANFAFIGQFAEVPNGGLWPV